MATISAGVSAGSAKAGSVSLVAGTSTESGAAGDVSIRGGSSTMEDSLSSSAGNVVVEGGFAASGPAGSLTLMGGSSAASQSKSLLTRALIYGNIHPIYAELIALLLLCNRVVLKLATY